MSGHKVLNRLIQVFIAVNMLLLIINAVKYKSSYVLSKDRVENITAILEQRGIIIDVPLPRVFAPKRKGTVIMPESTSEARERLVKALLCPNMDEVTISSNTNNNVYKKPSRIYTKDNISLVFTDDEVIYLNNTLSSRGKIDSLKAKQLADWFITKAGLDKTFDNAYIEQQSESGQMLLVYYPRFEGIPVFDSQVRFYMAEEGITKAIMHVGEVEALKEAETRRIIYPIDMVLFGIEESLDGLTPIRITDITLGYCALSTEGMDFLEKEIIPVYKITFDGLNEPIFVNAYTNKEIK